MNKITQRLSFLIFAMLLSFSNVQQASAQKQDETDRYFEISKNLEIFSNLFKNLNLLYVDPIEPGKLVKTGIDAMLMELDPYTNYYTEADAEDYKFMVTGKYGGIGTSLQMIDSNLVIDEPYQNGPVDKAGIKTGDIIVALDGQSVKDKDAEEISLLLRGSPGTSLKMTVRNPVTEKVETKTVERQEIKLSSVTYSGLLGKDKDIAYVFLAQFIQNSAHDIKQALDSMKTVKPDLKGIVLDLRGDPGGLLDEAVKICNLFIPKGQLVVSTKGKNQEWNKEFKTESEPWDLKIPVAVLVNHRSASASEIVAGTLQDLDRAVVIGTQSFGKGLVQNVVPLGYNTKLKVTTAKYYTPSGRCIQAIDYSHRNEDGSVSSVPDSLKKTFYTVNGRVVKDGGGIMPDLPIVDEEWSKIAISLISKFYIFNYATQYYYKHPSIDAPGKFKITENDFNDFKKYLGTKDYSYRSQSEDLMDQLKKLAEEEKYYDKIKPEFDALFSKFLHDKNQDLLKNKKEISELLTHEIVGRYYYQNGKALNRLSMEDKTLDKALWIFNNSAEYKKILTK